MLRTTAILPSVAYKCQSPLSSIQQPVYLVTYNNQSPLNSIQQPVYLMLHTTTNLP